MRRKSCSAQNKKNKKKKIVNAKVQMPMRWLMADKPKSKQTTNKATSMDYLVQLGHGYLVQLYVDEW